MTLALAILNLAVGVQSASPESIVFAATRYRERNDHVYVKGTSHLYRIRADGTGLKQLTFGSRNDSYPMLSQDRKHVLFWRSSPGKDHWPSPPFTLCSLALKGSAVSNLHTILTGRSSADGLARAMARGGNRSIHASAAADYSRLSLLDAKGKLIIDDVSPRFNPSGDRAFLYIERDSRSKGSADQRLVVNMQTGSQTLLDKQFAAPAWLDDRTLVCIVGDFDDPNKVRSNTSDTLALLNANGRLLVSKQFANLRSEDYDMIVPGDSLVSEGRRAFPLWDPRIFLIQAHHWMSDGGYDFAFFINMKTGKSRYVGEETIEAASANGLTFLSAKYDWVGGYKRPGSAKLCALHVWNAKTFNKHRIGFQLMECFGACFVPGNG